MGLLGGLAARARGQAYHGGRAKQRGAAGVGRGFLGAGRGEQHRADEEHQ